MAIGVRKMAANHEPNITQTFQGVPLVFDHRGIIFLPDSQTLIVSDLHLEKGAAFARKGQLHPPYDTARTLARLDACVSDYSPKKLVSLGDSFHDRHGARLLPDIYKSALLELQDKCAWIWISGNHDPSPPEGLKGRFETKMQLGPITLRHEPAPNAATGEISGHLHPAARIARRGKSVKRACFATDGARIIMPAFGTTTGSLSLTHPAFKGLFDTKCLVAHMMGAERIYSIPFQKMARK